MAKGFKTGGRELGTPNKTTSELRKVLKHMVDDELQNLQDNINELEPKERIAMTAEEAEEKDVLLHNKIRFGYLVIAITSLVYFITKY